MDDQAADAEVERVMGESTRMATAVDQTSHSASNTSAGFSNSESASHKISKGDQRKKLGRELSNKSDKSAHQADQSLMSRVTLMEGSSGESGSGHSPMVAGSLDDDEVMEPLMKETGSDMLGHHAKSASFLETSSNKSKRESLKVQKKVYRKEKKRAAKEILLTLKDPSVILMADYLKVRGMLKSWTKFWCILKPGLLILYKSQKQKSGHWVGTIMLNTAKLIERPSKKDGFCFKIYHPLDQSIWAQRGPKGESIGAFTQPLPYSNAIFRAPSETAGKTWMDALELALRCSSLLLRSLKEGSSTGVNGDTAGQQSSAAYLNSSLEPHEQDLDESDKENHFRDLKDGRGATDTNITGSDTASTSASDSDVDGSECADDEQVETMYAENVVEEMGSGGGALTEEFADENKSIIWCLMKQVRPGMDLSKVVLPTFILEPRSLLEKFADYYYHSDILARAALEDDAFSRMKEVVRWYVSGFYKTPKGVKKPYNPILGETFRCYWKNSTTGSKTFYIAEQISHHPPVSAFHVTNRKDGFTISCAVLAKSKFYGNSVSAVMDGTGKLTFLKLGEDYSITIPYGHAKGILVGNLTMELGGKIHIECDKTEYRAELEFKLKPFMGGSDTSNRIVGKIKLAHETLANLDGRWDEEIFLKDKATGNTEVLWKADQTTVSKRLKRYTVPIEAQGDYESEKLWHHVSEALKSGDQEKATHEKFILEDAQRKSSKERKLTNISWQPAQFEQDKMSQDWIYKYADMRPWDPANDIKQFECNYKVQTKTVHKTPLVRQMSIVNVNSPDVRSRQSNPQRSRTNKRQLKISDSSTPSHTSEIDESSNYNSPMGKDGNEKLSGASLDELDRRLAPLLHAQRESNEKLRNLQSLVVQMATNQERGTSLQTRDWIILAMVLLLQTMIQWIFRHD